MELLLAELNAQEDISIHYARSSFRKTTNSSQFTRVNRDKANKFVSCNNSGSSVKQCIICKDASRKYQGHDLSSCWHISKFEKIEVAKALQVNVDDSDHDVEDISSVLTNSETINDTKEIVRKVECDSSPFFYA